MEEGQGRCSRPAPAGSGRRGRVVALSSTGYHDVALRRARRPTAALAAEPAPAPGQGGKNLDLQWLPSVITVVGRPPSIQGRGDRAHGVQMIADQVGAPAAHLFRCKWPWPRRALKARALEFNVEVDCGASTYLVVTTYTRLALVAASSNPPSIRMSTLAHHWARKDKKVGERARKTQGRASGRQMAYVYKAATLMAAVCRGGAARRLARAMRAAVFETAAWRVQRAFRDKMVRKMLAEARRLRRARMRGRMQRWRMALGKEMARRASPWRPAVAAARLDALSAAARLASSKERNKLEMPPEDAPRGPGKMGDPVGRDVAFKARSWCPLPGRSLH